MRGFGTIRLVRWVLVVLAGVGAFAGSSSCGTVDLGDNFVAPDPMVDEDFFYCRIQPEVINATSCASGMGGESCHSSTSAMVLSAQAETDPAPACDGNVLLGVPPDSWQQNLEAVRFSVRNDPFSSPFYLRPIGMMSHPRIIFMEGSPEADLIVEWLLLGGS